MATATTEGFRLAAPPAGPLDLWRLPPGARPADTSRPLLGKGDSGGSKPPSTAPLTAPTVSPPGSAKLRILKLERNLAWLQDQHNKMLSGLHYEIEDLKNKNRDLQFALLLGADSSFPVSPPEALSSQAPKSYTSFTNKQNPTELPADEDKPEINNKGGKMADRALSPRQLRSCSMTQTMEGALASLTTLMTSRSALMTSMSSSMLLETTPLQLEILDNEIKHLQGAVLEARSRNLYLENLVDSQRRRLEQLEEDRRQAAAASPTNEMQDTPDQTIEQSAANQQILRKLAEAEIMLTRLQQDNEIQRRELETFRAAAAREARIRFRGCNHPVRTLRYQQPRLTSQRSSSLGRLLGSGLPPLDTSGSINQRPRRAQSRDDLGGSGEGSQATISRKLRSQSTLPALYSQKFGTIIKNSAVKQ